MSKYPLDQLVEIKQKRVDDALKEFLIKKKEHEKEIENLRKAEQKLQEIKDHYDQKVDEFYEDFQKGTTSVKIKRNKQYLKTVLEKVKIEKEKVKLQEQKTEEANQAKLNAKKILDQRRLEVEKLELHHKEWQKEQKELAKQKNILEQDEISGMSHDYHKRKKKKS